MDRDGDIELLERWCGGDKNAGSQIFRRYFDGIYRFFDNKVEVDANELVQATFLACLRGGHQFRGQSSLRTYLYAIARNELFAYLRKRQRHRNDLDFAELSLEALGTSPSSYVARGEAQKLLLHALRTLPLEQQLLLELHYWEDMDSTALAEVMALGEGAVRTRLSRARKTLRERMDAMVDSPLPAHASDDDLDAWARRMRAQGRPAK